MVRSRGADSGMKDVDIRGIDLRVLVWDGGRKLVEGHWMTWVIL